MKIEKTKNARPTTKNRKRRGMALLVVLFIVAAVISVSSVILYRADLAAAGGHNYALRTRADYIAWAGLEHARAEILADPNVPNCDFDKALFSLSFDDNSKDDFVYRLEITSLGKQSPADPNEYAVECTVYYFKDVIQAPVEEPLAPRSILKVTIWYEGLPVPKAWFTSIHRDL